MRDKIARRKWFDLLFVLAIALVIRAVYLYQFASLPEWGQLSVDNWYHHNWATDIASRNLLGDTTYFRAPFYAWCLGALYYLFSPSVLIGRLFGLGLGVVSVALTYEIAHQVGGRRAALTAALLQAIYPILIMSEPDLLLDPLFMVLLQAMILSLLFRSRHPSNGAMFVTSLAAGLAAITRPTALVLLPLIFGILLWQMRATKKILVSQFLAVVLGLTVTVGGVFARNLTVASDPVVIASQGGINFFIGNNDAADGLHAVMPEPLGYNWRIVDITYLAEQSEGRTLTPGQISSYWTGAAWDWIIHHPVQFVRLTVKRLWFSFGNVEIDNNRDQATLRNLIPVVKYNPLGFGFVFVLAVLGAFLTWQTSSSVRWAVAGLLALTIVNAFFFVNSRFRLPLLPVYFVLAAVAIDEITTRGRLITHRFRLVVVALIAGIVTFAPAWTLPRARSPQDELSKGLIAYSGGDYNGALDSYRRAFAIDSAFPDVNANLGAAFLRLGAADSARAYFQSEIRLHPKRSLAYGNLAALALVQGKYDSASEFAIEAINRKPYDPTPWIILIRASARTSGLGRDSLRVVCVRACNTTRNNLDVCLEAGVALDAAGDDEAAVLLLDRAAKSDPSPIEMDDRAFTSGYWSAIAKDQRQRARASMSLGAIHGRRGEYAQAATYSAAAIAADSTLSGAWVNLIAAKAQLGLEPQARELLREARARFSGDPLIESLKDRLGL